jgi:hypothetical protein
MSFYLDGDEPETALAAHGPVGLRLGRHAMVAIPVGDADEVRRLPDVLPAPARVPVADHGATHRRGECDVVGRLVVSHGDRRAVVPLSPAALRDGILVGRYARCLDEGVRALLDDVISRAHLLLTYEDDEVVAYDLCSPNGTWSGDVRVRRAVLKPGVCLRLARTAELHLLAARLVS